MRPDETQALIEAALLSEDWTGATRICLDRLGREIYGFLTTYCGDPTTAADAFAEFAEDVWRGVATFRREGRFRAWAYVVARHAADRQLRGIRRRADRPAAAAQHSELDALVARARDTTRIYQQTAVKVRFRQLIETLPQEDRVLLHLRLYSPERMTWADIAEVLSSQSTSSEDATPPSAAGLRKRYERLVQRLRELARDEGLLE